MNVFLYIYKYLCHVGNPLIFQAFITANYHDQARCFAVSLTQSPPYSFRLYRTHKEGLNQCVRTLKKRRGLASSLDDIQDDIPKDWFLYQDP